MEPACVRRAISYSGGRAPGSGRQAGFLSPQQGLQLNSHQVRPTHLVGAVGGGEMLAWPHWLSAAPTAPQRKGQSKREMRKEAGLWGGG